MVKKICEKIQNINFIIMLCFFDKSLCLENKTFINSCNKLFNNNEDLNTILNL